MWSVYYIIVKIEQSNNYFISVIARGNKLSFFCKRAANFILLRCHGRCKTSYRTYVYIIDSESTIWFEGIVLWKVGHFRNVFEAEKLRGDSGAPPNIHTGKVTGPRRCFISNIFWNFVFFWRWYKNENFCLQMCSKLLEIHWAEPLC